MLVDTDKCFFLVKGAPAYCTDLCEDLPVQDLSTGKIRHKLCRFPKTHNERCHKEMEQPEIPNGDTQIINPNQIPVRNPAVPLWSLAILAQINTGSRS